MPTIAETLKRLATTFTVRDIMTGRTELVCAADEGHARMVSGNNPEFDVIPIRSGETITGYFNRALCSSSKLTLDDVISDRTNLLDLVDICQRRQFSFVLGEQDIKGYVHLHG